MAIMDLFFPPKPVARPTPSAPAKPSVATSKPAKR
jgi:hypothetical protein